MAAFVTLMAAVTFWPGAYYIRLHEGDTLHLISILLRMEEGQRPHLDFMTPIGALAFAPIVLFMKAGFGVGTAILAAQYLVVALLAPAIWWVALSRYPGRLAWLFAGVAMTLILGMMFGGTEASVSISMHYNRWAWAVTFVVVSAALLPVIGRERPRIDGLILGAGAAALVLIKLTFFVGVVPAIILLLLLRRDWITLVTALSVGLLVAVSVVFWAGFDYWLAYLRDLLVVASSDGRSQPSESYGATAASPAYLGASLLALAAVVILRRSGARMEGLALLLLYPGFVLVAWQNWGNEPTWLWLLGLLLMALRPTIADLGGFLKGRAMLTIVAAMALALSFGPMVNMLLSPFRHLATDKSKYVALVPGDRHLADLLTVKTRALRLDGRVPLLVPGAEDAPWNDAEVRDEPAVLAGEVLASCEAPAWYVDLDGRDRHRFGYGGLWCRGADFHYRRPLGFLAVRSAGTPTRRSALVDNVCQSLTAPVVWDVGN